MAEEEVAELVVGNDSGMCKASFAGDDAPDHNAKAFAKDVFIDQERMFRHRLNHKPCRLEDGRLQFYDSFSTLREHKDLGVLGEYVCKAETGRN